MKKSRETRINNQLKELQLVVRPLPVWERTSRSCKGIVRPDNAAVPHAKRTRVRNAQTQSATPTGLKGCLGEANESEHDQEGRANE